MLSLINREILIEVNSLLFRRRSHQKGLLRRQNGEDRGRYGDFGDLSNPNVVLTDKCRLKRRLVSVEPTLAQVQAYRNDTIEMGMLPVWTSAECRLNGHLKTKIIAVGIDLEVIL
jgi:hypothetical protein